MDDRQLKSYTLEMDSGKEKIMADRDIARQIIEAVGGESNVLTLGHCMTRLRFTLKDMNKADDAAAKAVKGVKGISRSAGQYQMIIGTGEIGRAHV